jgi:hypothetical protein
MGRSVFSCGLQYELSVSVPSGNLNVVAHLANFLH